MLASVSRDLAGLCSEIASLERLLPQKDILGRQRHELQNIPGKLITKHNLILLNDSLRDVFQRSVPSIFN